jgi:hypothetical protein
MFERSGGAEPGVLDAGLVAGWRRCLGEVPSEVSDVARIDLIRTLEELKAAAAAAQARVTADLDASVRSGHRAHGVAGPKRGAGVGAQVALARRESPVRGGQHLGLATALVHEMPHTLAALAEGRLSEWRATVLVRETACLSRQDRGRVDAELVADPGRLDGLGDRRIAAEARRVAYRLDPAAALARASKAERDRRVTLRPAPDTMTYLTALLPVRDGVAAYAALDREAAGRRAGGDGRSRGQLMADTLLERVTGRSAAAGAPVLVALVMTDRALLAGDPEPAEVPGYGPVPAPLARQWLRPTSAPAPGQDTGDPGPGQHTGEPGPGQDTGGPGPGQNTGEDTEVWLRRLFTHPGTGQLVAMESAAVAFPPGLRRLLVLRDQVCRTPWCDAPVRHADHVLPLARGGATEVANGQGLCEQCNYLKESPGWSAGPAPGSSPGRHLVETVTPTGHHHQSRPPPLPGWTPTPTPTLAPAAEASAQPPAPAPADKTADEASVPPTAPHAHVAGSWRAVATGTPSLVEAQLAHLLAA